MTLAFPIPIDPDALLAGLNPGDAIEQMQANFVMVSYQAGMEEYRHAARREVPVEMASAMRKNGLALLRFAAQMLRRLEQRQGWEPPLARRKRDAAVRRSGATGAMAADAGLMAAGAPNAMAEAAGQSDAPPNAVLGAAPGPAPKAAPEAPATVAQVAADAPDTTPSQPSEAPNAPAEAPETDATPTQPADDPNASATAPSAAAPPAEPPRKPTGHAPARKRETRAEPIPEIDWPEDFESLSMEEIVALGQRATERTAALLASVGAKPAPLGSLFTPDMLASLAETLGGAGARTNKDA